MQPVSSVFVFTSDSAGKLDKREEKAEVLVCQFSQLVIIGEKRKLDPC